MPFQFRAIQALIAAAVALPLLASAQAFPTKPVRIIVPFSAGGASDVTMRAIATELGHTLGQAVIVDNKPGAGGMIGAMEAVKQPPDGHTLLAGNSGTHVITPLIKKDPGYDATKDFTPIAMVQSTPLFLVVNPSLKVDTLAQFIALAKSKPGEVTIASPGNGHTLALAYLSVVSGAKFSIVPYKGPGPALTDTVAGHVNAFMDTGIAVLPQVKTGRLKVLAITSLTRAPNYPDIPAIAETYSGYEAVGNNALYAAGRIPPAAAAKLTTEVQRAIATPQIQKLILDNAGIPINGDGAQVTKWMRENTALWKQVIEKTGVVLE
jgi:tripartite-type tricarboxylate transporter receptor subunit TctC